MKKKHFLFLPFSVKIILGEGSTFPIAQLHRCKNNKYVANESVIFVVTVQNSISVPNYLPFTSMEHIPWKKCTQDFGEVHDSWGVVYSQSLFARPQARGREE